MRKPTFNFSLQNFLGFAAAVPLVAGIAAGVFGELLALVTRILLIAIVWFGFSWIAVLGLVRLARALTNRGTGPMSVEPRFEANPPTPPVS